MPRQFVGIQHECYQCRECVCAKMSIIRKIERRKNSNQVIIRDLTNEGFGHTQILRKAKTLTAANAAAGTDNADSTWRMSKSQENTHKMHKNAMSPPALAERPSEHKPLHSHVRGKEAHSKELSLGKCLDPGRQSHEDWQYG